MSTPEFEQQAALNADREIWRERPGDYYAPHIFVTTVSGGEAGIGMDVGGYVIVMPIREWHTLARFHVHGRGGAALGEREKPTHE